MQQRELVIFILVELAIVQGGSHGHGRLLLLPRYHENLRAVEMVGLHKDLLRGLANLLARIRYARFLWADSGSLALPDRMHRIRLSPAAAAGCSCAASFSVPLAEADRLPGGTFTACHPRYRRKSTRVAPRRHRNLGHRGHNPPFHLCATWNRDFAYYWWARARDGGKYRSAWCALGPACCRHNSPVSRWISASCQRSPVLETTVNASPIMCPPSSAWPTVPYASGQQCH
jgi:hypothetical protein